MRPVRIRMPVVAAAMLLVSACSDDKLTMPTQPAAPPPQDPGVITSASGDARTDFQLAIEKAIAQREASGLPVPSDVSFEYESATPTPFAALAQGQTPPGEDLTIVATTVVRFANPAQAGLSAWPAVVVVDTRADQAEGFVHEGDYTDMIRDGLAQRDPGIWTRYEFGQEPRTYTFIETYKITPPESTDPGMGRAQADATSTAQDEIVMGFTVPGPMIDHTITFNVTVETLLGDVEVIDFVAGFRLDWALGVRLPMAVSATSSDPVLEGSIFVPTSNVMGLDWSATDFTNAGILPEDGNEFVMRFEFLLGIFLSLLGEEIVSIGPNIDVDESSSFASPFGPGAVFDLPSIDLPIYDRSFGPASFAIGFEVTPQAGSDKFTAAWTAAGEASGSGSLRYTNPDIAERLASVTAIDGPGVANITLRDFKFVFTRFLLDLALFLDLGVEVPVFDDISERFTVPVTDFDLSGLLPDLDAPVHAGSSPTTVGTSVTILNVAPTAEIDRSGTMEINGVPTFLTNSTTPLTLTGTARDPGRDDLTLMWDFDNGPPAPDESTTYPVPKEVTESQTVTFGQACLFQVGFKAVDDDAASGEDQVTVLATESTANRTRQSGYWGEQMAGGGHFDGATLECYLQIAGFMSTVFDEARDASTLPAAAAVLHNDGDDKGGLAAARRNLDRQLLAAWINFANGAFALDQLFTVTKNGTATPFADVMAVAESVRLDPGATRSQVNEQAQRVHFLNRWRPKKKDVVDDS